MVFTQTSNFSFPLLRAFWHSSFLRFQDQLKKKRKEKKTGPESLSLFHFRNWVCTELFSRHSYHYYDDFFFDRLIQANRKNDMHFTILSLLSIFFFIVVFFFISETILTVHYHRCSNILYVKLITPFFYSRWKLWWRVSSGHLKTEWQGWAGSIIKLSKPSEKKSVKDVEFKIFILNEIIKGNPFQNDLIVCSLKKTNLNFWNNRTHTCR